ncbi:MAG: hypothetical protein ACE5HT_10315 [Gemmatimonadales bacterium]
MAKKTSKLELSLSGYGDDVASADIEVASFDQKARLMRALKALGIAWGLAAVSVPIVVAHFFLVPGFVVTGIVLFVRRLRTEAIAVDAHGTCPNCGTEQRLDLASRWHLPQKLTCCNCQRSLTLYDSMSVR